MKKDNHYSTVTSKGQVTIPVHVRNKLHLSSGSKIEFILQDDCMIILPINNNLTKLKGILPKPKRAFSCEEMDETIRSSYAGR